MRIFAGYLYSIGFFTGGLSVPLIQRQQQPDDKFSSANKISQIDYVDTSYKYESDKSEFKALFEGGPVGSNEEAMSGELDIDIGSSIQEGAKKRNCFIMSFRNNAEIPIIKDFEKLMARFKGSVHVSYQEALKGTAICFPENELPLELLKQIKWLKALERDKVFKISQIQSNAPFGLDRLSGMNLPLNGTFGFDFTGQGVNIYIVDTVINVNHTEFSGRATAAYVAPNLNTGGSNCSGHGTETASLAAGKNVGVAKLASIFGVAVLDCSGDGFTSDIIAGLNWIMENSNSPSLINMSLGGPKSTALDSAVSSAFKKGYLITVASGNENQNACNTSPGGNPDAISVGATTNNDARASFSNYGRCVDIMAPGQDVTCANPSGGLMTNSGTSFAAPYVAGVLALLYQQNGLKSSASTIKTQLFNIAVSGKLSNLNGSPNILLQAPAYDPNNTAVLVDFDTTTTSPPPPQSSNSATHIFFGKFVLLAAFFILNY